VVKLKEFLREAASQGGIYLGKFNVPLDTQLNLQWIVTPIWRRYWQLWQ